MVFGQRSMESFVSSRFESGPAVAFSAMPSWTPGKGTLIVYHQVSLSDLGSCESQSDLGLTVGALVAVASDELVAVLVLPGGLVVTEALEDPGGGLEGGEAASQMAEHPMSQHPGALFGEYYFQGN